MTSAPDVTSECTGSAGGCEAGVLGRGWGDQHSCLPDSNGRSHPAGIPEESSLQASICACTVGTRLAHPRQLREEPELLPVPAPLPLATRPPFPAALGSDSKLFPCSRCSPVPARRRAELAGGCLGRMGSASWRRVLGIGPERTAGLSRGQALAAPRAEGCSHVSAPGIWGSWVRRVGAPGCRLE